MNDEELLGVITRAASDVLDVSADTLDETTTPEQVASWDSIMHLTLVLAVEQALGVSFAPERIADLTSIGAILDEVRRLKS